MPTELIGFRRLFDSIGGSLEERDELEFQCLIGNIVCQIYMGPSPKFGIFVINSEGKYIIPGEPMKLAVAEFNKDASKSSFPRHFFTEIVCFKKVEVSQEISEAFHSKSSSSHEPLINMAQKDESIFKSASDLIAGTIGLRYHWQFVIKIINEEFIAIRDTNDCVKSFYSPSARVLESIVLNSNGMDILPKELADIGKSNETSLREASKILHWLIRSWGDEDTVSKFVNLFIPMEMVLAGYTGKMDQTFYQRINIILKTIDTNCSDEKNELKKIINDLMEHYRPSLVSRFEEMASKAQMTGYDQDIVAFKRFNTIRNAVIHKGKSDVTTRVTVSEDEVRDLEDLVERYVSYNLFGDARVYKSRFRPPRNKNSQNS